MPMPTSPPPSTPPALTPARPSPTWQLHVMGRFELSDGVQRHTRLAARPAMALLARLAMQPASSHPRETLAALLWPEAPGEVGRKRLRHAVATLKQVLEPVDGSHAPVLDADRYSLRLVPGRLRCDALDFEAAFRSGDHDLARALYTGELLPGFFDEWIGDERLRLEGLFDRLRPAQPPAPPGAAAASVAAFARPGQAGPAPGGMAVAVLSTAPASAPPAAPTAAPLAGPQRTQLPAYLTLLIAADRQALQLRAVVSEHRLVTLMGPGGAGKTRLAVAVAQALADAADFEFVVFVPLAACSTRQQLLDQLLLSLRLGAGKGGTLATLVQALAAQRALLLLDNFEQLVDVGAEAVAELAAALPQLHLLVTSRRALGMAGERELVVDTLALPAPGAALPEVAASPAVRLFVERAGAARAGFTLDGDNAAAVVDAVRLLDGMPLAIELAAARVRSMPPAEIAATLQLARSGRASALELLARTPQPGRQDIRHQSMQDTIAWSWQLLGEALRSLLSALTVFDGGFTSAAAAAVCGDGRVQAMAAQLDELLQHSLLRLLRDGTATRFALYEPIREFALQHLAADTAAALRQRHRAWAAAWGRALPLTPAMPALRAELPNLVAAMASAVADGAPHDAIAVAEPLRGALEELPLPGAGLAALEAAAPACSDPLLRSAGLSLLARQLFLAGRGGGSMALAEQGLALAPPSQPALRARALLGVVYMARYELRPGPTLLPLLDEAQALGTAAGDAAVLALIAACRADIVRDAGELDQAEALQRSALASHAARGDRLGAMRCRYSLALLAERRQRHDLMLAEADQVVAEARQLQVWVRLAAGLHIRAGALRLLRRWPEAADSQRAALQVAWQALAAFEVAYMAMNLPRLILRTGHPVPALTLIGFCRAHWQQRFGPWLETNATRELPRVERLCRRLVGAAACAEALAAGERLSAPQAVALALAEPG